MFERSSKSAAVLPPLPDTIPDPTDAPNGHRDEPEGLTAANVGNLPSRAFPFPFPRIRTLRHGCYLMRFTPSVSGFFTHYDGTLRVQRSGTNTTASGDLYVHNTFTWPPQPVVEPAVTRIPVFARARYRYYLRVTQILEWITFGNSFTLGFERYRFEAASNSWTNEGAFTAVMTWGSAPAGWAAGTDYLSGQVRDAGGATVGTLTIGWVSPYLRRAVVEVDRVADSEVPETSGYQDPDGTDIDWRYVFDQVDWNVTLVESDANLPEPSGESWSDAEMHQEMLARRDNADLDGEWRYHLICVRLLDSTSRGIMYDAYGGDSNNIPREGAGLSSHWMIPNTAQWGNVQGQRFGAAAAPYFRTAVHELGHAMGLYHNSSDNGFMNTTPQIAASGTASNPFPDNVQWSFNVDDSKRLRHMPDPWVRPGMIPFGQSYSVAPISPDDMAAEIDGLELSVTPLLEAMPLGAPVRVDVEMVNRTGQPLPAPMSLSLKSGHVHGRVIDAAGNERVFWPMMQCVDEVHIGPLAVDDAVSDSMTLLRGPGGALFPMAGPYRIVVEAEWQIHGHQVRAAAATDIMVTAPQDEEHAKAALTVLTCPDVLPAMVVGGDHLEEGVAAIQTALNNPVLRPHYAVIESKRRAKSNRDAGSLSEYIDESTVVSKQEVRSWEAILKPSALDDASKEEISKLDAILNKAAERLRSHRRAPAKEA